MNFRGVKKFIFLFLIVVLPVIGLLVLKTGKNKYKELPILGNKYANEKGDTVYHTIPPFSFIDQTGKPYGSEQLKGRVYVAEFFFTRCPNICPVITNNLKTVYDDYNFDKGPAKDIRFVSFSLDPKHDSTTVLARYADKYKVKGDKWHFLTGNRDSIFDLMNEKGFMLLKPEIGKDPTDISHSQWVSLIDKEGRIRGIYDGTNKEEIEKLRDEIRVLLISYESH